MRSASRPLRSVILRAPTLRASPRDTIDLITAPLETKVHGCRRGITQADTLMHHPQSCS